jgi:hypothetical protein
MSSYIAIDAGAKGCIASVSCTEPMLVSVRTLTDPPCLADFCEFSPTHYTVVIEEVPMGGWGVIPQATVAKLHQGYGIILGILETRGFRVIKVKPQAWQKTIGAGSKRDHGKDWKKHLANIARQRFPNVEFNQQQADALLILDHARQLNL